MMIIVEAAEHTVIEFIRKNNNGVYQEVLEFRKKS